MQSDHLIREETPNDVSAIDAVHQQAFGRDEPIPALVNSLRNIKGAFPTISIVAQEKGGEIIGHVMLSHSWLDAPKRLIDVLVLSPLGVTPEYQRQGVGKALLKEASKAAASLGSPLLFLEGNPAYYGDKGYAAAIPMGFHRPSLRIPERAFQVIKLPNYTEEMTGTLVYRDVFWELDCVGLR